MSAGRKPVAPAKPHTRNRPPKLVTMAVESWAFVDALAAARASDRSKEIERLVLAEQARQDSPRRRK